MSQSVALMQTEANCLQLLISALDAGANPDLLFRDTSLKGSVESLLRGSVPKDPLELSLSLEDVLLDSKLLIASQEGLDILKARKAISSIARLTSLISLLGVFVSQSFKAKIILSGFTLLSSAADIGLLVYEHKRPYVSSKEWFTAALSELEKIESEMNKFLSRCHIPTKNITFEEVKALEDFHEKRWHDVMSHKDPAVKLIANVVENRVELTNSHLNAPFCQSISTKTKAVLERFKTACEKQDAYSKTLHEAAEATGNKLYTRYAKATDSYFYDFIYDGIDAIGVTIVKELQKVEKVVTKFGEDYQTFKEKESHT